MSDSDELLPEVADGPRLWATVEPGPEDLTLFNVVLNPRSPSVPVLALTEQQRGEFQQATPA